MEAVAPIESVVDSIASSASTSSAVDSSVVSQTVSPSLPTTSSDFDKIEPHPDNVPSAPIQSSDKDPVSLPQPVEAQSNVLQSFPKDNDRSDISIQRADYNDYMSKTYDFNKSSQSIDLRGSTPSEGFNLMSSIKNYFNQPIEKRSDYPNFSSTSINKTSSSDKSSNSLSNLSTALLMGPRLSLNPTINVNQKQNTPSAYNAYGSQRQN